MLVDLTTGELGRENSKIAPYVNKTANKEKNI